MGQNRIRCKGIDRAGVTAGVFRLQGTSPNLPVFRFLTKTEDIMFRIILLGSIAPFLIACQTTANDPTIDSNPNANMSDAVTEPTDGIANEVGVTR